MLGIHRVSVIITTVFLATDGFLLPAGKCDTNRIQTCYVLESDYTLALTIPVWKVVYGTYAEEFKQVDQASATFSRNDEDTHTAHLKIIMRNFNYSTQDARLTFNETVITEDSYDNETGEFQQFKIYPLANTAENALLFYRCSETGGVSVDTRYIVIPATATLSEESLKFLMNDDQKQDFHGQLVRLPYTINTRLSATTLQKQNMSHIREAPSVNFSGDPL